MILYQRNINEMTRSGNIDGKFAREALPILNEMIYKNLGKEGKEKLIANKQIV